MNKEDFKKAFDIINKNSQKRNFKQSYELIVTLKELNLKKPEEQVDFYAALHYGIGKKITVCALVGPELIGQAKESCDMAVVLDDFEKYQKDKKALKKLAKENDYFIAQANIMPKVAASFGRVLGPKGKMPNPKAGCIVPPNANIKPLYDKLQKTIKVSAKTALMIQAMVGKEGMDEKEIMDNILTLYDQIIHHTPKGALNVRHVLLKMTMGKPFRVGAKEEQVKEAKAEKPKEDKKPVKEEKVKEEKAPETKEEKSSKPQAELEKKEDKKEEEKADKK